MKNRIASIVVALCALLIASCAHDVVRPAAAAPVAAEAAVAMPDRYSAQVTADVLKAGGNAVDAAVAAAFTLAVTYPEAGNIGGGGFMMIWMDGQPAFLDYRETAPGAASRDMYLDKNGQVIEGLSLDGAKAVGVPGTVEGMWEAHRRYGHLAWKDLVAPAVKLAEDGFVVPPLLASHAATELAKEDQGSGFARYFGGLKAGTVFRQPELATVLRRIQADGTAGFYRGKTAALLVAQMRHDGGLITAADLQGYKAVWRAPIRVPWRQYEILGAPPPSSGGVAIIQLLKMKDDLASAFEGLAHNSPQYIHLTAEMEKRVFADRAEYLGDPGFVDNPVASLIDDKYVASRAAEVNRNAISQLDAVRPGLEQHNTVHFSIVDRSGNAVSNTYTLNTYFGSRVVVDGGGFLLNNEMDDFSVKPGVPNYFGVVGSTANAVQPGKRMLSSMSPTILLQDGKVKMVVGSPGGSTIITSVYQAIVNVLDFGMSAAEAVGAARFHHQLLPPDLIYYSPSRPLPAATIEVLDKRGYRVLPYPSRMGDLQLIVEDSTGLHAASDPRQRGVSTVLRFEH